MPYTGYYDYCERWEDVHDKRQNYYVDIDRHHLEMQLRFRDGVVAHRGRFHWEIDEHTHLPVVVSDKNEQ